MTRTLSMILIASLIIAASCAHPAHPPGRPLPPGHAKKLAAHQSAKPFAPGQKK